MRAKKTHVADADTRPLTGSGVREFDTYPCTHLSSEGDNLPVAEGESLPAREASRVNHDAFLDSIKTEDVKAAVTAGVVGIEAISIEPDAAEISVREQVIDHELFHCENLHTDTM